MIMQKVITINLNGNAYQLDESGYDALHAYLEHAEAQLGSNPDRAEIVRDLERSVAEKCMRVLGPGKTVVSASEVEQMLREIGPVESGSAPHVKSDTDSTTPPPKRLYQIREGAIVSGVCNGIAAYFNLDPTIVRVTFVVSAFIEMSTTDAPPWMTAGMYVLLVFVVPYAKTSAQLAAAQGSSEGIPYRIQEFVETLKRRLGAKGA
ncbi:MAG TPA: PspC domain-containing protein [Vicinamibacterales bacterium]|nr:PspC domain-containing protein [Vicinamibacterales bacterium]